MGRVIWWLYILGSYLAALIMYILITNLPSELKLVSEKIEKIKQYKEDFIIQASAEEYDKVLEEWQNAYDRATYVLEMLSSIDINAFNNVYMILFITAPITLMPYIIYKIIEIKLK